MSKISKELIENYRKIVLPFVSNQLYKTNFEGRGETDKTEFEQDFNEILDLAIKGIEKRPQGDLIKAFELLKAYCKNRECNKDCVFYRELRAGNNIEQFCGLCDIVTSDDSENEKKNP